ncbi:MAG TPA: methyltransferase domain-containing protein [Rhodocyclaceae bacterium]|nr:methyltransferase domain-containing protein [Rhodocyclaceae bacterium]
MLTCPICGSPFQAVEGGVVCGGGHRFDRARQGYLNLLPVQHKRSRDPGDNQVMVEARRRFLEGGHYAPVARQLAEMARNHAPRRWLDIGCGEGYYSAAVAAALPRASGFALDISREAVRRACRRTQRVEWLVASMARIPMPDRSCGLLISVFSPLDWSEARRLLAPGGRLLRVGPTNAHLMELRAALYEKVRDYVDDKHLTRLPADIRVTGVEHLEFALDLDSPESRADLMAMTPHGWRASALRRSAVADNPLRVTVSMRFDWFERQD